MKEDCGEGLFKLKQPDGAVFLAKRYDNGRRSGIETLTGYPITKNDKGYWVYEKRTIQGILVPTNIRADNSPVELYQRQDKENIGKN